MAVRSEDEPAALRGPAALLPGWDSCRGAQPSHHAWRQCCQGPSPPERVLSQGRSPPVPMTSPRPTAAPARASCFPASGCAVNHCVGGGWRPAPALPGFGAPGVRRSRPLITTSALLLPGLYGPEEVGHGQLRHPQTCLRMLDRACSSTLRPADPNISGRAASPSGLPAHHGPGCSALKLGRKLQLRDPDTSSQLTCLILNTAPWALQRDGRRSGVACEGARLDIPGSTHLTVTCGHWQNRRVRVRPAPALRSPFREP